MSLPWKRKPMLKIQLLRDGQVIETVTPNGRSTLQISRAGRKSLGPKSGADDWELAEEAGLPLLTKARWILIRQ